jgi:Tfp pilus assembly protein PilN
MIKINLLGKKKAASPLPFGLDERLEKMGISAENFADMRPALIRAIVLAIGLYVGNYVPNYFHQKKIEELEAVIAELATKTSALQRDLAAKKDIRKQMEQLNKEETELQRQLNAVNGLQKDRGLAFRTLDNLSNSMPQKVWLRKFDFNDRKVTVGGSAWEYFPITDFVRAVNESTQYSGVVFKDVKAEGSNEKLVPGVPAAVQRVKSFEIDFQVKSMGEM